MIKPYYLLAKPRIVYGNTIVALAGFLLAAKAQVLWPLLLAVLVGLALVIASACVFNNYMDRAIDVKMNRTKNRVLVQGLVSGRAAFAYGIVLGLAGMVILLMGTNWLAASAALVGFWFYVVMYGMAKRRSVHGSIVGSIAGAMPLLVGYLAVTGHFDIGAGLLFLVMALWQMPHFYAIALLYSDDYAAAGIPVLPVAKGVQVTKIHMLLYVVAYTVAVGMLTLCHVTGFVFLTVMLLGNLIWLGLAINGFGSSDTNGWARMMFRYSLVILLIFCLMISIRWAV